MLELRVPGIQAKLLDIAKHRFEEVLAEIQGWIERSIAWLHIGT